ATPQPRAARRRNRRHARALRARCTLGSERRAGQETRRRAFELRSHRAAELDSERALERARARPREKGTKRRRLERNFAPPRERECFAEQCIASGRAQDAIQSLAESTREELGAGFHLVSQHAVGTRRPTTSRI